MNWRNNKYVAIGAAVITLISIILIGSFFTRRIQENLQWQRSQKEIQKTEEYKKWKESEDRAASDVDKQKF